MSATLPTAAPTPAAATSAAATHPPSEPCAAVQSIRFEVRDGTRRVLCAVSNEALEAVSALALPSTDLLRRKSFDRFRTLIDAAAKLRLRALPSGALGPILLTTADLRFVPPENGVPSFGSSPRTQASSSAA